MGTHSQPEPFLVSILTVLIDHLYRLVLRLALICRRLPHSLLCFVKRNLS